MIIYYFIEYYFFFNMMLCLIKLFKICCHKNFKLHESIQIVSSQVQNGENIKIKSLTV